MRWFPLFLFSLFLVVGVDQGVKSLFLAGFTYQTSCFSLILTYNSGVAFSFLAELGGLKYLLIGVLVGLGAGLIYSGIAQKHPVWTGVLLGSGLSNLLDRFLQGGVVDYFYWHCGFKFAIFNLADVLIDLSIAALLLSAVLEAKGRVEEKEG